MVDPCSLTQNELSPVISRAIDETLTRQKEHGFIVFSEDGELKRTDLKTGSKTSIILNRPSVLGLGIIHAGETVGAFHTHPNLPLDELLSMTDIRSMFREGVEFSAIGYIEDGMKKVAVFDRQGFDTFDDFRRDLAMTVFNNRDAVNELEFVREANIRLLRCQFEVGEADLAQSVQCQDCGC